VVLGHSRIECPNFPSPCIANGDIKSFPSRTHCFTLSLPTANSIIGLKHSYCYETTLKNNLSLHKDKILVCPCARTQISAWISEYILFFSFPFETTYLFRFYAMHYQLRQKEFCFVSIETYQTTYNSLW
jgi:hypothetical protein